MTEDQWAEKCQITALDFFLNIYIMDMSMLTISVLFVQKTKAT